VKLLVLALAASTACTAPVRVPTSGPQRGAMRGVVRDIRGEDLSGVAVIVTSEAGLPARGGFTDERGAYRIQELPAGTYSVLISMGSVWLARRQIVVAPTRATSLNIVLSEAEQLRLATVSSSDPDRARGRDRGRDRAGDRDPPRRRMARSPAR
jgi:hypothetical protein